MVTVGAQPSSASGEPEDPLDRAMQYRKNIITRLSLTKIGFWPGNRGGNGIGSWHVHEVAKDLMTNKVRPNRYAPVDVMEIPPELLEEFRAANKEKCENDPLMPKYSEEICYVCAAKTHFTHALKLGQEGDKHLFGLSDGPLIQWQPKDQEARDCMTEGPACQVFSSGIFKDPEAVEALNSSANANSQIEMEEDEMQVLGRIDALIRRMANSSPWKDGQAMKVLHVLQKITETTGLGNFTHREWEHLISLRVSLQPTMTKVLTTCQFEAVCGRVRVRASDFGLVAKMPKQVQWGRVAVLLYQYDGSLPKEKDDMDFT